MFHDRALDAARTAVAAGQDEGVRELAARIETYLLGDDLESVFVLVARTNATPGNSSALRALRMQPRAVPYSRS